MCELNVASLTFKICYMRPLDHENNSMFVSTFYYFPLIYNYNSTNMPNRSVAILTQFTNRSQQNIDAVQAELTANPEASTRQNNFSHLTMSSFNRIAKFDLKFHPFRMIIRHQLFHGNLKRRTNFWKMVSGAPSQIF